MVSERIKVHLGLAAALIVLVICVVLLIVGSLYRGDLRAALPGSVAPDFALRDANNRPVELSELRGNVVIVCFRGQPGDAAVASTSTSTDQTAGSSQAADSTAVAGTATEANSDLLQLSAMCDELHNPHLKIFELTTPSEGLENSDPLPPSQAGADSSIRTLLDPSGDIARKYKVDNDNPKPTFFIIDPSGVIRYRGNSLQPGNAAATDQLLSPATEPSSCPQLVQTLLSSEAVNISLPPPATK